jgi:hypothetical protein
MARIASILWAAAMVSACSGNPFEPGTDGGGGNGGGDGDGSVVVPDEVTQNLRAIGFDTSADDGQGRLVIDLDGLVASSQSVEFVRAPGLDLDGYSAFVYQETLLQRAYLALVAENARGTLEAYAVADGGNFNTHIGGTSFKRMQMDLYSPPDVDDTSTPEVETGQFSYVGSYGGVFVPGVPTANSLPDDLEPARPLRVQGVIQINANFANSQIEGGISDRVLLDDTGAEVDGVTLQALALRSTGIDDNGQFLGEVEIAGTPGNTVGDYAGLFGGAGATDVAGVLVINPLSDTGIWEYGAFNLPRCDLAGSSPLCVPR